MRSLFDGRDGVAVNIPQMCVNGELTRVDILLVAGGSLVFLILCLRLGRIAWRSSPDEYISYVQSLRPKSWRNWPVFASIWSFHDSMPVFTRRQAQIGSILGVGMGLFGIFSALVIVFHEQLGIPACVGLRPF
jgi:hypothetical protein